ncbi:MAG: M3 family oligoendopeptidase [Desulfobulbaceae bacterium]|nr:M3 family oligoendopeptidase [Desulfobulbaceae bacterium]
MPTIKSAKSKPDPLKTAQVLWKLTDLYASPDSPELTKDLAGCEKTAATLRQKYENRVASLTAPELFKLVKALEELETSQGRIATYAYLNFATQTKAATAGALLQKVREFNSRVGRETVFFELEWNLVEEKIATQLLKASELNHYRHYLASLRRYAPHQLSKIEETLLLEKGPVGRSSWNNLFDKVMGHLQFGKSKRSEEEVLTDLYAADRRVRRRAAAELTGGLSSQLHILTHIFNTILADKMIDDRLRLYSGWVSSMNLNNELDDTTVAVLIQAVTARYDIVQRYYRLKKKLLKLSELTDYDRYAPLPHLPEKTIPWPEAQKLVLKAFNDFAPEMGQIAERFFNEGWIHAPIVDGKRGGAFAHPCVPQVHPYVMVNYTGTLRDVSTVAHELGHGVHQFLAAKNGYYNSDTTLVLAETASVFAESLLFKSQLELIDDPRQRRAFTCQKLESIFATVFRQVAMNRFEDLIHNGRRDSGELSAEALSAHWLQSQRAMFGNSVNLREEYGIWWSYIPHFLSTPGYVYSYAFGELLVLALYHRYRQDPTTFVPKYLELLAAGGKATPYELLKPFGIDLNDPEFWQGGLHTIEEMLSGVE